MVIKKQREKLQFLIKGNSSRTDRIAFDFPSEIEFDGLISPFYLPLAAVVARVLHDLVPRSL